MGVCSRDCWDIFNRRSKLTFSLIVVVLITVLIIVCLTGQDSEPVPVTTTPTTVTNRSELKSVYNGTTALDKTLYRCYNPSPVIGHVPDHISCYNMRLNETHPYVKFITNAPPEQVTTIYLGGNKDKSGSQMHTFTNDICNTFPNLEEIEANNLGLQKIMDDAFANCTKMIELRLSNNLLTEFTTNKWHPNRDLKDLYLEGNNLQHIDRETLMKTFPGMQKLTLSQNGIENQTFQELVKGFQALKVTVVVKP